MSSQREVFEKSFQVPIGVAYHSDGDYIWLGGKHHGDTSEPYDSMWKSWQAAQADQATTIKELKKQLSRSIEETKDLISILKEADKFKDALGIIGMFGSIAVRAQCERYIETTSQLQLENQKLRDALVIAKGLLDAMKWSNEEPHEGSFGWIINQALEETK